MELLPATHDAALAADSAFNRAIAPDPERTVSQWADAERVLGGEESPYGGPWQTARVPFLRDIMDCTSLSHPARRVSVCSSAQVGKTNVLLNMLGQIACETPCAVLCVLPSIDESRAWNREKLQPLIDNSPAVRRRVLDLKSRDESSSTTMYKRFPAGNIELTGANSSKGLQMRTKRVVLFDEISEFPFDVDGRGDPVAMAEARTTAWTGREKIVAVSTPGLKSNCRITARYDDSSRGKYHVPCPDCGHRQPLVMTNLKWTTGQPSTARYYCQGCGAGIEHWQKPAMLTAGAWVHEFPELLVVHAGFSLNALYSPFVDWAWIARKSEEAEGKPEKLKVFTQQIAGEAYEERHDVVPHQALWERRTSWPAGRIPAGVLFLTGATDVQGDRLEWAIYGHDRHGGQWWLDGGILEGNPAFPEVWAAHDALLDRSFKDAWGQSWKAEAWGIDTGFLSQHVYGYCRRHSHRGQPRVMALDGRAKWGEPPIGMPKKVDIDFHGRRIGSVVLWPVGTWDLKSDLTSAMRLTEQGPDTLGRWPRGAMRFPDRLDLGFFEQLTSEACRERRDRSGNVLREWIKVRARNEQFDLAVYARAIAKHETVAFTDADWDRLEARRLGRTEPDLLELMQSGIASDLVAPVPPPPPAQPVMIMPAQTPWIDHRDDWFARED